MTEFSLLALWSNNQKMASDIIYSSLLQEVEVEHTIVGYSISRSVFDAFYSIQKISRNSKHSHLL